MDRRSFLYLPLVPAVSAATVRPQPEYRVVTKYSSQGKFGMPGPYPGQAVSVHAERSVDSSTGRVDAAVVREMLSRAMCALTGDQRSGDAWKRFFNPADVVGIKLNCSGAPGVCSKPEVVGEIARNLVGTGVKPENIYLYERFENQIVTVPYARFVPAGVQIHAVERDRGSSAGYDPHTYVEVNFFGEDDTRSNLVRLVSERLTKIINVPNIKDHGAAGVTGCLKNIAYGNFSNVARSHQSEKTNTLSFIGTLAAVEPLRSKTVLHIMDGLKGVWHGGPFVLNKRFVFYPKQIMVGTDPVAIDRQLLDVIEAKRRAEHAVSVWDRSTEHIRDNPPLDPNFNHFIREPGHIEYASRLGLGVYDQKAIRCTRIEVA
jgi:uncharacterized protein (DUF362 family)